MTRTASSQFPELQRVFEGYLHEDAFAEGATPEDALKMFWDDAAPDERRRFQREVRRFLTQTADLDLGALRDLVRQLGCRWAPPSREAIFDVLADAAHLGKRARR